MRARAAAAHPAPPPKPAFPQRGGRLFLSLTRQVEFAGFDYWNPP